MGKKGGKADSKGSSKSPAVATRAEEEALVFNPRTASGVLASYYLSRDIKIETLTLSMSGNVLLADANLHLNFGKRYGLLGANGCGKSTLMKCLGMREVPIPNHIDIYHLEGEYPATEETALQAVYADVERQRIALETEAEELALTEEGQESERLAEVYSRLDELDADTAEKRAGEILHGLGFTKIMMNKKAKDLSGGWRMRISLAKALFIKPMLLLLDEPTNHLDLEACVWLENYLSTYNRILLLVSHSQDFLNGVCTDIIHFKHQRLEYYTGNFDTYVRTRGEKEENQMKAYSREQEQIAHMKNYIARFGHGSAKLARQAQSKEKTLAKMEQKGLTEIVTSDRTLVLRFNDPGPLPPPIVQLMNVAFGYTPNNLIYKDLDFGLDLDSRIALVGPNGAGKSTLLKIIQGTNSATSGMVRRHQHLRIGYYHQHMTDLLDMDATPLDYMMNCFPGVVEYERMRAIVGKFGITGKAQTTLIKLLSDGQKTRVVFAWLAWQNPHLLLLDEPTNHLDIETIDSLADAINEFEGGCVLVSHDFRLINQIADEIWICEHGGIEKWNGDIQTYKETLRKKVLKDYEPKK
jgi:ATP-binding cassette subfamily F protein 2